MLDSPIDFPPATEIVIILSVRDNAHNELVDTLTFTTIAGGDLFTVSGNVYLSGETNHSGTVVMIIGSASDTTDAEGYFEIPDVPQGTQFISLFHDGYYPIIDTLEITGDMTVEYTLEPVPEFITVSGVVELEDETDYTGSMVWVEFGEGEVSDTAITDELGRYTISDVLAGTITVHAEHEGFIPDMNTMTASTNVTVDFTLEAIPVETWSVSGYVTLEDETDYTGTIVSLGEFIDTTDSEGLFVFEDVPTGTYTFTATHDGFETY